MIKGYDNAAESAEYCLSSKIHETLLMLAKEYTGGGTLEYSDGWVLKMHDGSELRANIIVKDRTE